MNQQRQQQLFIHLFPIRSDEFTLVLIFFLYYTCIGIFITIAVTVGDSLLLTKVVPEKVHALYAWMHVGIAIATIVATWVYDSVTGVLSRRGCLLGIQSFLGGSILAFRWLILSDVVHTNAWIYFGLVIWLKVCGQLLIVLFFSYAGDYFTTHDAKRLYGLIAGGLPVGSMLGGSIIGLVVGRIGSENMLYLCIGFVLVGMGCSLLIDKIGTPVARLEHSPEIHQKEKVPLRALMSQSYIRFVFLGVMIGVTCFVLVDFQFKITAKDVYSGSVELAAFLGNFYMYVGIMTILFQFLLVKFLLRRFGVITSLMILPGIYTISSMFFYATGYGVFANRTLIIIATTNFFRIILSEALILPSRELLFLPLSTSNRIRAQAISGGIVVSIGQGVGGIAIIALTPFGIDLFQYSLLVLCLGGIWIGILGLLRARYRKILVSSLKHNQLDARELREIVRVQGARIHFILEELLKSPDEQVVSFTLDLLRESPTGRLVPHIRRLAHDSNQTLAAGAIALLGQDGKTEHLGILERALTSSSAMVREAAVLAVCQIQREKALHQVQRWIISQDPTVRQAALVGCGRYCGSAGNILIQPVLASYVSSADSEERLMAARVLQDIHDPGNTVFVERLLDDSDKAVQVAAVETCGTTKSLKMVPHLLRLLNNPQLRSVVRQALIRMPEESVPMIVNVTRDPDIDETMYDILFQVLASIGGRAAEEALWGFFSRGRSLLTRIAAGNALWRMALSSPPENINESEFDDTLKKFSKSIRLLNQACEEIGESDELLWQFLHDHAQLEIENLFHLLALKYNMTQLEKVRYNFFHSQGIQQANALELLDELLPRRIAPDIVRLLDTFVEGKSSGGKKLADVTVRQLMQQESWLKVVTAYHLSAGASVPCPDMKKVLSDQDQSLYQLLNTITFLKNVPLFRKVPGNYLVPVAKIAHVVNLNRGDILFQQGDRGDAMYLIGQGTIGVQVHGVEVNRIGGGEGIGEMALLDGSPRSASCIAADDCELVKIAATDFGDIVKNQSDVALALLRTLAGRLRQQTAKPAQQEDGVSGTVEAREIPPGPPLEKGGIRTLSPFSKGGPGGISRFAAHEYALYHLFERIAFLKKVPLFSEVPEDHLLPLADLTDSVSIKQGEILFQQGDQGDALYLIRHGSISIQVNGIEVNQLGVGEYLGEMSLLDDAPRSAACIAREDTELLKIAASDFETVVRSQPSVVSAMLRTLAARLRQQTAKTTFSA